MSEIKEPVEIPLGAQRSLAQIISFWVLGLSMLSNILLGGGLSVQNYLSRKAVVTDDVEQSLLLLSEGLAKAIWTFDEETSRNIAKAVLERSHGLFARVRVTIPGQEDIRYYHPKYSGKSLDSIVVSMTAHTKDLMYEGQKIGEIELLVDQSVAKLEALKALFFSIPLVLALTLGFAVVIYTLMRSYLSRPLAGLVEDIRQAELQNFDVRAREDYHYELGLLGRSFNRAIAAIQARDMTLKKHLDELEVTIEQRTHERDEQIARNVNSSRLASLGELSASMAHEINNPMAVILGNANRLETLVKESPNREDLLRSTSKIKTMGEKITKIIKGLRNLSREGSQDPMLLFSSRYLLEEVTELVNLKLQKQGVFLEVCKPEREVLMFGREIQISQVLMNLIGNASDAVADLPEKWVRLELEETEFGVEFRVTDSGLGIPPEIRRKIHEPFFTTKGIGKGTGLGLSISQGIVKEHQGQLFYNDESPNTQFVLRIPHRKDQAQAA